MASRQTENNRLGLKLLQLIRGHCNAFFQPQIKAESLNAAKLTKFVSMVMKKKMQKG